METKVLIQTFTEFAKQKNVDRPTMIRILQDVFRAMIKKRFEHDENFDIEAIDLEDKKVYDFISRGETIGVFQLESSGMIDLCKRIKPDS